MTSSSVKIAFEHLVALSLMLLTLTQYLLILIIFFHLCCSAFRCYQKFFKGGNNSCEITCKIADVDVYFPQEIRNQFQAFSRSQLQLPIRNYTFVKAIAYKILLTLTAKLDLQSIVTKSCCRLKLENIRQSKCPKMSAQKFSFFLIKITF